MKNQQQTIVLICILASFIMVLFPPWTFTDDQQVAHPMGYAPIWKKPVTVEHDTADFLGFQLELNRKTRAANSIDLTRLMMQVAILFAATGGAIFLMKQARA